MLEAPKKEFEFKEKLESWVEGLFDAIASFLRTVFTFNCRPFKTFQIVQSDSYQQENLSQPGIFMILSYVLMLFMIKDIDFSDPVFSYNLAALLNALGALEKLKDLSIEKLIVAILPAIGILMFCVYVSVAILWLFGEKPDSVRIRKGYSYILGNLYLVVGIACLGYRLIVKPLSYKSWWLGLPIHIVTLWPLVGSIMLTIFLFPTEGIGLKGFIRRLLARSIPWAILMLITWHYTGSIGFMDYRKAR
jgi:hypothetical protein